jgi:hypothetical protein
MQRMAISNAIPFDSSGLREYSEYTKYRTSNKSIGILESNKSTPSSSTTTSTLAALG